MSNQRGIITIDFLFSIVLVMGLSGLLFVMTLTLSVASLTQYITFASSRVYSAAHFDLQSQEQGGQKKYQELIQNKVFAPLYKNGWFSIDEQATVGDHTKTIPEFASAAENANTFYGSGTSFTARVLAFKIPFLGSTTAGEDDNGDGFKTYIGSYLGREPTMDECLKFNEARWNSIRSLSSSGGASYSTAAGNNYYVFADNGC